MNEEKTILNAPVHQDSGKKSSKLVNCKIGQNKLSGKTDSLKMSPLTPKKSKEGGFNLSTQELSPVLESVYIKNKNCTKFASSTPGTLNIKNESPDHKKPNLILNALDKLCSPIKKESNFCKINLNKTNLHLSKKLLPDKTSSVKRLFSESSNNESLNYPPSKRMKSPSTSNKNERTELCGNESNDHFPDHDISDNTLQVICEATNHIVNNLETEEVLNDVIERATDFTNQTFQKNKNQSTKVEKDIGLIKKENLNDFGNDNEKVLYANMPCNPFIYSSVTRNFNESKKISLNELFIDVRFLEEANKLISVEANDNTKIIVTPKKESHNQYTVVTSHNVSKELEKDGNKCKILDESTSITDTQFCEAVDAAEIITDLDQTFDNIKCNINNLKNEKEVSSKSEEKGEDISIKTKKLLDDGYSASKETQGKQFHQSSVQYVGETSNQCRNDGIQTNKHLKLMAKDFQMAGSRKVDIFKNLSDNEVFLIDNDCGLKNHNLKTLKEDYSTFELNGLETTNNTFILKTGKFQNRTNQKLNEEFEHNNIEESNKVRQKLNDVFEECEEKSKDGSDFNFQVKAFETASGKNMDICEESPSEAIQKLNYVYEDCKDKNKKGSNNKAKLQMTGLETASEKNVHVSKESFNKARQKLNYVFGESEGKNKNYTCDLNSVMKGFQTASGNNVDASNESLNKARQKLNDVFEEYEKINIKECHNSDYQIMGFQTLSGKNVNTSEESFNKARLKLNYIFEECEESAIKECNGPNFQMKGFQTANGKNVHVSNESLNKARQKLNDVFEESDIEDCNVSNFQKKGFQTASEINVNVSKESLNKAREKLNDVFEVYEKIDIKECHNNFNFQMEGFQTASGKNVYVTKESLNKARQKLNDVFEECEENEFKESSVFNLQMKGFQTANGKNVDVSKESLNKARQKLNDVFEEYEKVDIKECHNCNFEKKGFQTGSGKNVNISEESLNKARQKLNYVCKESYIKQCNVPNFQRNGFQTASGKIVNVSEESLNKARQKLNDVFEGHEESHIKECNVSKFQMKGFQTASGKNVDVSKESLNKARQKLNDVFEEREGSDLKECNVSNFQMKGFQTASGNNIDVSNESLNKARQKLNDVFEECEGSDLKECNVSNFQMKGFQTASGKNVDVSNESLNKARQKLNDVFEECERSDLKECNVSNFQMKGFQTASGKNVDVSKESLNKARQKLNDVFEECEGSDLKECNVPNFQMKGFQTASGKNVDVSKESLNKARQKLNDVFEECEGNYLKECNVSNFQMKEFQTASGKNVDVSNESLNKARQKLNDVFEECERSNMLKKQQECVDKSVFEEYTESNLNEYNVYKSKMQGFQTASGRIVEISKDSLNKARELLELDSKSERKQIEESKSFDFKSERREAVNSGTEKMSETSLHKSIQSLDIHSDKSNFQDRCSAQQIFCHYSKRARKLFNDDDSQIFQTDKQTTIQLFDEVLIEEGKLSKTLGEEQSNNKEKLNDKTPTRMAKRHFSVISEDDLNLLNKSLTIVSNSSIPSINETKDGEESSFMSQGIAHEISESLAALMADEESSAPFLIKPCLSSPSMIFDRQVKLPSLDCYENEINLNDKRLSPILDLYSHYKPASKVKRKIIQNDDLEQICSNKPNKTSSTKNNNFKPPYATSTPNETVKKSKKKRLLGDSDNVFPFKKREKIYTEDRNILSKAFNGNVALARKQAAERQEISIHRKGSSIKPCKGLMLLRKQTDESTKLQHLTNGCSLQLPNIQQLRSLDIKTTIIEMSASNALDFKFVAHDYFGEKTASTNIDGIPVGDGALLILDGEGKAGIEEITRAFLASPAVDPLLISKEWVKNHFRWIVLKMAAMERMFPERYGNRYLTPNNLMLQLKYRYDREIDRCQRSAIRKILEKDESPAKPMVLFVADITDVAINEGKAKKELELCDGWYNIKTTIDHEMEILIIRKIVSIGTKLLITGADIVNIDDGCHPLEAPSNARLKVSTNSCRRVRWYTRLGFSSTSLPVMKLQGVLGRGGTVPTLSAVVVRTYPPLFLEKQQEGKTIIRGERAEQMAADLYQTKRQQTAENILSQLQCDLEKSKCKKKQPVTISSLKNANNDHELLALLEGVDDLSIYQDVLSKEQLSFLQEYKQEEASKTQQQLQIKLMKNLNEKMPPRVTSKLVKVRLSDMESKRSSILTVWNPSDDILSLFTEGNSLIFHNLTASGYSRFGDLQLTGSRYTRYSLDKYFPVHRYSTPLKTFLSPDFKPEFSEVDVVGVVLPAIDDVPETKSRLVYIADDCFNFLGISFSVDMKDTGFVNIITPGSIVAACNLHWRSNVVSWSLPCAVATELSTFSQHPRKKYLQDAIRELHDKTTSSDLGAFIDECVVKIKRLVAKRDSAGTSYVSTSGPSSNTTTNNIQRLPLSPILDEKQKYIKNTNLEVNGFLKIRDNSENCDTPVNRRLQLLERFGEPPPISPLQLKTPSKLNRKFRPPIQRNTDNR